MSSGHGLQSKQGRCYAFWDEVAKCRAQPEATVAGCRRYVEDYLECLFHKKEVIHRPGVNLFLDFIEGTSHTNYQSFRRLQFEHGRKRRKVNKEFSAIKT